MSKKKGTSAYKKSEESLHEVTKGYSNSLLNQIRLDLKFKNDTQHKLYKSIVENDVTVCIGPAGCGKSLVALYTALKLLKEDNKYKNIVLLKPMAQLSDETLPALPGDAMMKMLHQNMSFYDSLSKLIGDANIDTLVNDKLIKFDVIGSFRGRDLAHSLVLLDETQNLTHDNLKTLTTRMSENSKLILLGDPDQIDLKDKRKSSLRRFSDKIKLNPMEGVCNIEFTESDIVRHRLTSYFIKLFKED